MSGIGKLQCAVVDVDDLAVAERFYSALTGLAVIPSFFPGRYSYVGTPDPWRHELILHLVRTPKPADAGANRAHVDIWVRDVDAAITQVEEIGGHLKRAPSIYPRPGSYDGEPARIDWAVARDPFGNEFCLISVLAPDEARAVHDRALEIGDAHDDDTWRRAAGRAPTGLRDPGGRPTQPHHSAQPRHSAHSVPRRGQVLAKFWRLAAVLTR